MAIDIKTGMVTMLSDKPLVEGLPIDNDSYIAGDLFTLRKSKRFITPKEISNLTEISPKPPRSKGSTRRSSKKTSEKLSTSATESTVRGNDETSAMVQDAALTRIDSDEFQKRLRTTAKTAADGTFTGLVVADDVVLRFEGDWERCERMIFRKCVFEAKFRLGDLRKLTAELRFEECEFRKGIDGSDARLSGKLSFDRCLMSCREIGFPALDLRNAQLESDVILNRCLLLGNVLTSDARVDGNFIIRGCRVGLLSCSDELLMGYLNSRLTELLCNANTGRNIYLEEQALIVFLRHFLNGSVSGAGDFLMKTLRDLGLEIPDGFVTRLVGDVNDFLKLTDACEDCTTHWDQLDNWGTLAGLQRVVESTVDIERARIAGDLEISNLQDIATVIDGNLLGRNLSVNGEVKLSGTLVRGWVHFEAARIHGKMHTRDWTRSDPKASHFRCGKFMSLKSATIGELCLGMTNVGGELSLYQATVSGMVDLLGLTVGGDLQLGFARIQGFLGAFRQHHSRAPKSQPALSIGGDLAISGAEIVTVELRGIEVTGQIKVITGRFGRLFLSQGLDPLYDLGLTEVYWPEPCRAAALTLSAVTVQEKLDLSGLRLELPEDQIEREQLKRKMDSGVTLTQCRVGSDLTFFDPDPSKHIHGRWGSPNPPRWQRPPGDQEVSSWKSDKLAATSAQTTESKAATNEEANSPRPEDFFASIWGKLNLQANRIDGHLDLRNVRVEREILLNDTHVGLDLSMAAAADNAKYADPLLATTCGHLDMEKLQCRGDVNLTGLRVLEKGGWKQADVSAIEEDMRGTFRARGAEIAGELLLYPRVVQVDRSRKNDEVNQKQIGMALLDRKSEPGTKTPTLDLSAVKANHLILTEGNVPQEFSAISLERAHISRLEIIEPTPGPIDLSAVRIDRWVFGQAGKGEKDANANDYIDVLKKMDPFDRSTWLAVESYLRNSSQEIDADCVYSEMRSLARKYRKVEYSKRWPKKESTSDARGVADFNWRIWMKFACGIALIPMLVVLILPIWFAVFLILLISMIPLPNRIKAGADNSVRTAWHLWDVCEKRGGDFEKRSKNFRRDCKLRISHYWWLLWDSVQRKTLNYGTSVILPLVVWIAFFLLSWRVFSFPQNVAATTDMLQTLDHSVAALGADSQLGKDLHPKLWSIGNALVLAARYHVPIIPALTLQRWEASRNEICWYLTAEGYAFLMIVLNWIIWPVFLIRIAAVIFRGKRT